MKKQTNYVDGFVFVVPKDKIKEYRKMATFGRDAWMKHGALAYFECRGEDIIPKEMGRFKMSGFAEISKAKETETVWLSFITFKSKKHRDEVNKKAHKEMMNSDICKPGEPMPFDMARMTYGGFKVEVSGEQLKLGVKH